MRARRNAEYILASDARRFWGYVDKSDGCWIWIGQLKPEGYGRFTTCLKGKMSYHLAHRWSYQALVGSIPDGLTLDHLCRDRRCVNPSHLEAVTNRVNIMRGNSIPARRGRQTHCLRGHALSGYNVMLDKHSHRSCRKCKYKRTAAYQERKNAEIDAHA